MKYTLPLIAALSLSACMSMDDGPAVTRTAPSFDATASCAYLANVPEINRSGGRCGPQTELPYTIR